MNVVVVSGVLSRDPQVRVLPSGSQVISYDVTTRREGEPAESVPIAWVDPPTRMAQVGVGDEVVAIGRVRRRFFRSGGATQSRTEVAAERVVKASNHRAVAKMLVLAADQVSTHSAGS